MIKLEEYKHQTENKAIEKMPLPAKVYIPLSQHLGKICIPEVKMGDYVFAGQKIGSALAHVYAPVHASLSGKVTSIQEWPHPVLGRSKAIVIDGDGKETLHAPRSTLHGQLDKLSAEQIRNIVLDAGIVGMGGASFPTYIKLNPPKPVDTLIINGAECEPYLTGDYRLMLEKTKEILQGVELVARCLGIKQVYIAIEDNKPEAIKAFESVIGYRHFDCAQRPSAKRPEPVEGLSVIGRTPNTEHRTPNIVVLKSAYPQGGEKQLIKNILGKEVPSGKLPFDIGVVVHNVATVFAIYEAIYFNKPLYERVVTVGGNCLTNPKNLLVRLGTPIKDLVDFCGPLKEEPAKIIIGGPMMGIAQFTDDVPVIKSTTGVLLFSKKEASSSDELPCIRCGACVRECPAYLMPTLISLASQKGLWSQAKVYGAPDCIECGVCSYVCPSNIRLVQHIKRAKLER